MRRSSDQNSNESNCRRLAALSMAWNRSRAASSSLECPPAGGHIKPSASGEKVLLEMALAGCESATGWSRCSPISPLVASARRGCHPGGGNSARSGALAGASEKKRADFGAFASEKPRPPFSAFVGIRKYLIGQGGI